MAVEGDEVVEGGGSAWKGRLFPGGNQYDHFMECLVVKYPQEFAALGISQGDLGLHSARKGVSSHACSGTTVSPQMVSICLRAMWSMGHMKERYLQYEKVGGQYFGQVVSGLDVNSIKFAVSPPYFEYDETGGPDEGAVASLCFHFDFLKRVLHNRNKFRASHFFTHIPIEIQAAGQLQHSLAFLLTSQFWRILRE